ncbi:MAG: hypothetical protein IBX36_01000 [Dehalococcoidia bacterium]|nr:hypothetical protein [Dehalococcoidia bacterium]
MSEQLGEMGKPSAEEFRAGRKLFFVPLIFTPREPQADFLELVKRYWDQVQAQIANLEVKLAEVNKVYHELIPDGGEAGAKAIEELNTGSYQIIKTRLDKGAVLLPIEDSELLIEFMDWSKCLAVGLQSQKVFAKLYESYEEARKRRNDHIAKQIDETLKSGETGILLMREGHQVQFPSDIQVFYIAPPGLDEIKRWLRGREA